MGKNNLFIDIHAVGHRAKHVQSMAEIFLNSFESRSHITSHREKLLGLMAFANSLASNDLVHSLHCLILVTVGLDLPTDEKALNLLGKGSRVVLWQGSLTQNHRVGHVGVEGSENDSQGADVEWGNLLSKNLGKRYRTHS